MTYNNIYEYFKDDENLWKYFDPASTADDNKERAMEIYLKLVEYSKERKCFFKTNEMGYIFYSKKSYFFFSRKVLISFCVKPKYRTKENLVKFGEFIRETLGAHFKCYLYNVNIRGIRFLEKIGMKKIEANNLVTLLSI